MGKNITIIPPSGGRPDTLRVVAYCRVSTDLEEQASSYASQIRSYTELIRSHEGWELVDIYADEAASGTKMDKREDFNRMLADCRKGKIDRVLVKSISRFARNTRDCLAALRELARLGYRRRMEMGQFISCKPPYGYRLLDSGTMEIIPEEAEVIQWVYDAYLSGQSAMWIANDLIRREVRDRKGDIRWSEHQIYYWLSNEKYIGDTLCQRQAENVDFRRNGMSFFGGQHSGVYSPYAPLHLPA